MTGFELGNVAYIAYAKTTGNKNYQGKDMPKWDALPPVIQKAWCNAALAAVTANSEYYAVSEPTE